MNEALLELAGAVCYLPVQAVAIYGLYLILSEKRRRVRWRRAVGVGVLTALSVVIANGVSLFVCLQAVMVGLAAVGAVQFSTANAIGSSTRGPNRIGRNVLLGYGMFLITAFVSFAMTQLAQVFGWSYGDTRVAEELARSEWPFLVVVAAPLAPAILEELVYRQVADRWLSRWLHSPVWTAALSSLLWAGAHLGAGTAPWYLPLIELGLIVGPLSFYLYRRYGLFTVIVGHYLHNAYLFAKGSQETWMYAVLLLPFCVWPLASLLQKANPTQE
ncbi:MAG TPA: CPBP family intramembrane glutamic endopeptidase [Bacilli bacterium]|nr:CPBP family intramembrane glutamic endopeptidase [Bacilli bacterium]